MRGDQSSQINKWWSQGPMKFQNVFFYLVKPFQRFDGVGWRLEQTMMSPPQLVATLALLAVLLPTTKALRK